MARVMTLEGLSLGRVAEIREQLYGSPGLGGVLDPIKAHPFYVVAGLVLGAWLAGSATGRRLIKRGK